MQARVDVRMHVQALKRLCAPFYPLLAHHSTHALNQLIKLHLSMPLPSLALLAPHVLSRKPISRCYSLQRSSPWHVRTSILDPRQGGLWVSLRSHS